MLRRIPTRLIAYHLWHCLFSLGLYFVLLIPLIGGLYKFFCQKEQYDVLVNGDLMKVMVTPFGFMVICLLLGVTTLCILFEIGGLTFIQLKYKEHQSLASLYKQMIRCFSKGVDESTYKLLLYFAVITPALGLIHTEFVQKLVMPIFIRDFLAQYKIGIGLLVLLYLGLISYGMKWMFALYLMIEKAYPTEKAFEESALYFKSISKKEQGIIILIYMAVVLSIGLMRSAFQWSDYQLLFILIKIMLVKIVFPILYVLVVQKIYRGEMDIPRTQRRLLAWALAVIVLVIGVQKDMLNQGIEVNIDKMIAHRGGYGAEENTLEAIQKAKEKGVQSIEIDIQPTKDGQLVLFHDKSLWRKAGSFKKISQLNYEEIEQWMIYKTWPSQVKIPRLESVFQQFGQELHYNIELKFKDIASIEKTLNLIQQYNLEASTKIISTDYQSLCYIESKYPQLETGLIVWSYLGDLSQVKTDSLMVEQTQLNRELIQGLHHSQKKVFAWTVNDRWQAHKLLNMKVDGLITDTCYLSEKNPISWFKSFVYCLQQSIPVI